jgi:alpha-L-rhamnosidase
MRLFIEINLGETMKARFRSAMLLLYCCLGLNCLGTPALEESFKTPPDAVKPWVFWFWINGNISRDGITKDLESMKRVGIGGVIWMEVSGPQWAPQGPIESGGREWRELMQWAISEADRLGMAFDLSVDFGYGSGGPHITPDSSMQKIVWSETPVTGGRNISLQLPKPLVDYKDEVKKAWLRPGQQMNPVVMKALKEIDSYRDISVFAIPASKKRAVLPSRGTHGKQGSKKDPTQLSKPSNQTALLPADVIDVTDRVGADGALSWDAPAGDWVVVRLGHASNFKMTRPSPQAAVGLECDRLHPRGIDTHFEHQLKPILEAAKNKAGRTLQYVHVDSWEAGFQDWTTGFTEEFKKRRGYDIRPWLPVLTGHCVKSADQTDRFRWDINQTVSELTLANYIDRLRERLAPYDVKFSCEPYGHLCVNDLDYASRGDFPIAEFWTERDYKGPFPTFSDYWYNSMKGIASVANTYGKPRIGAESFTGSRGWVDHPYLIKGMGDEAFCNGISHYIFHLSAHQAYDSMKPGLTHRKWGQHFNRQQTWWEFSKPYMDYVARCQLLLQQGRRVVDVACLYQEGAPLDFNNLKFGLPTGHDYDLCTSEIIQRMTVANGLLQLPSGVNYRYLVLPGSGRLTLPTARKVAELQQAGAHIYLQAPIIGTPGLEGYPQADQEVKAIAKAWPVLPKAGWGEVFASDKLAPDFQGDNLKWIHRRIEGTDIYFVANTKPESMQRLCSFRCRGKIIELWDPETGNKYAVQTAAISADRTDIMLRFEPAQSWFVVFRNEAGNLKGNLKLETGNFQPLKPVMELEGAWQVTFDPKWGGPEQPVVFNDLTDWTDQTDPGIKYYSGTATYRKKFEFTQVSSFQFPVSKLYLDLGKVEVMARVKVNNTDCGIAWKPPYRVEISHALRAGENELEIEVVNTWVNLMIGDEQLPLDSDWKDWETLLAWPDWFKQGGRSSTGRYTFTTVRHYKKESPLLPSGLLGPVKLMEPDLH